MAEGRPRALSAAWAIEDQYWFLDFLIENQVRVPCRDSGHSMPRHAIILEVDMKAPPQGALMVLTKSSLRTQISFQLIDKAFLSIP